MIDNMSAHREAWREFCSRRGLNLTDAEFKQKISGRRNDQIIPSLFGANLSLEQITAYANEKESVYRELYKPKIKPVPGLLETFSQIKRLHIKLAMATAASKENCDFSLAALGLNNYFDVILGETDVKMGKPDPEIYLQTAARLNVGPDSCLVFEDSPAGVQSGKNAGMKVVGITTSHTEAELAKADLTVKNFSELELI